MPPTEVPGPGVLDRARIHAALTIHELWIRYFALGGSAAPDRLNGILTGGVEPGRKEYNLLVDSLNERFMELDLDRSVAYAS